MPIIVINQDETNKFDDIVKSRDMLLRYHSPGCGHCIAMEDEWKSLDNEPSLKDRNIAVVDIDVGIAYNINHPSAKTAIAQGVPSIYFIKKNQMFEYSGERKAKKIAEFAIMHTKSPMISPTVKQPTKDDDELAKAMSVFNTLAPPRRKKRSTRVRPLSKKKKSLSKRKGYSDRIRQSSKRRRRYLYI